MKTYSTYKDSGLEWIGEIPTHWDTVSVKWISEIVNGSTPKRSDENWNGNIYWITPSDIGPVKEQKYITDTDRKITSNGLNSCGCTICPSNSLVITNRGPIGNIIIPKMDFTTNQGCKVLIPSEKVLVDYLYYIFKISSDELNNLGQGTTFLELSTSSLGKFTLTLPPLPEQKKIVSFLDKKTSKIDRFIQSKQRKIDLLKEKRTSLINEVVTKGLNPDVELKDSGVEWIGKIPSHWDIPKLWYIVIRNTLGGNYSSSTEFNGIPLMKMGNMDRGKIKLNSIEYLRKGDSFDEEHLLSNNDFLFNTRNSEKLVGKVCLWRSELEKSLYNSNIMKIEFNSSIQNKFMNYLFNTEMVKRYLKLISKGTTSVSGIYYKDLSDIHIIRPPLKEQIEIVEYLDSETYTIDQTIQLEEQKIDLLKEYKQSLISEVVTGKINVQDEVDEVMV